LGLWISASGLAPVKLSSYTSAMSDRRQINVRADDEFLAAIEEVRLHLRPIPTVSAVIRQAVLEKAASLRRRNNSDKRRGR
jgi:hypothetical protein